MSTRVPFDESSGKKHDDVPAAPPSPPEAHPLAGALTESLRQADEPPSEATQSPNPSQPGGPEGTAGALTYGEALHERQLGRHQTHRTKMQIV